ncbi:MAG: alpha-galactosidase [Actinomycetaceae bacterium]|nr:alpha-galactosidase [Actinomycetaceae bacterium]
MSESGIDAVYLTAGKTALVLDNTLGGIPEVCYWGQTLGALSAADVKAVVAANREVIAGNAPDEHLPARVVPLESDGWLGRPALVGNRKDGTGWTPRFQAATFQLPEGCKVEDGVAFVTDAQVAVETTSQISQLSLKLTFDASKHGLIRLRAQLTNLHESDYYLNELGVALPMPLEANEILDTSGRWGKERVPQRRPVVLGCDLREGRHGRTGFDAPGFTFVGSKGFSFEAGEVWGLHNAWSGNHRVWVERMISGQQVVGASEVLMPGEVILKQGETYSTPWFYALHANGLDDAARQVHAWFRDRENHPKSPRPVALNVWEAVYFDHSWPKLQQLAKKAAEIGVERFVLDDGWFLGRRDDHKGLGDWFVDPDVWPQGLTPLADLVHDLGMQFGLWFEPEMINEDSDLAREHPDWIMAGQGSSEPADLPVRWRHQQVLNIAIPEAFEYIKNRIVSLVHEYSIDYIKWDHNRDLIEAGTTMLGGRASISKQTRAVYRLFDQIKAECPGLEIESCSSGGGRVDMEVLQHTDRFWASDCIDPVDRQVMMRWYNQITPPELMGTHVASSQSHTTGRSSTMAMRGATALWGHFGIEWDILSATDEEIRDLAAWINFYKANREFLHSSNVVRCETPDETIMLSGVVAADQKRALFQMATHDRSAVSPRGKLRFSGLDDSATYRIRPVIVGSKPAGLLPAPWFGALEESKSPEQPFRYYEGVTAKGSILTRCGLQVPNLYSDQALLFEVVAE